MKKIHLSVVLACLTLCCFAQNQGGNAGMHNAVELFELSDVHVTGGEMKTIQELSHKYLLTLEPERLLSWFRREAGLTPKAYDLRLLRR